MLNMFLLVCEKYSNENLDNVDGKWFIGFGDEVSVMVGVEV